MVLVVQAASVDVKEAKVDLGPRYCDDIHEMPEEVRLGLDRDSCSTPWGNQACILYEHNHEILHPGASPLAPFFLPELADDQIQVLDGEDWGDSHQSRPFLLDRRQEALHLCCMAQHS
jgi:hypothetical protein